MEPVGLPPLSPSSTLSLNSSSSYMSMVRTTGASEDGSTRSRSQRGSKRRSERSKENEKGGGKGKGKGEGRSRSKSRRDDGSKSTKPSKAGDSNHSSRGHSRGRSRSHSKSRHKRGVSRSVGHSRSRGASQSRSRSRSRHSGHARSVVRFCGRVQFRTIRHIQDFKRKEVECSWYCKADYERMLEDVRYISDLMAESAEIVSQSQDFSINGREMCSRGLEHLVDEDVADYRSDIMTQALDAVLDEQEMQRAENSHDPTIIANIYQEIGLSLQREAYLVALRDALEVLHIEGVDESSAAQEYKRMSTLICDEVYQPNRDTMNEKPKSFGLPGPGVNNSGTGQASQNLGSGINPQEKIGPTIRAIQSPNKSRWSKDSPNSKNSRHMPIRPRKAESPESGLPPISPDSVVDVVGVQSMSMRRGKGSVRSGGSEFAPLLRGENGTIDFRDTAVVARK